MVDDAFTGVEHELGITAACRLTGRSRATHYRRLRPSPERKSRKPQVQPSALTPEERAAVLELMNSDEYAELRGSDGNSNSPSHAPSGPAVSSRVRDDRPADYADVMSPSGWTRLTEAQGARRRLAIICGHVIRRPFLILALAGLAFLITRFGKDFPMLYGMGPLGAVLILGSMGRYHPAADHSDEPSPQDTETK